MLEVMVLIHSSQHGKQQFIGKEVWKYSHRIPRIFFLLLMMEAIMRSCSQMPRC